ncbi:MAG TPA: transcription termination/antitermination NusG family protein [Candidatus Angelobacter sp.]|nr:transcription termination/antitermination NusG family protein [Candidatus Angelobacter sp.]
MGFMPCDPITQSFWYALATKPHQEDRAAENLTAWGIPTLAPKFHDRQIGRKKPLFPGYIFACFNMETMIQKIRFTRGIAYVVSFGGKPAEIGEEIILAISRRIGDDGSVLLGQTFKLGDPIIITSGPLRDLHGIFEKELSGSERVQILLATMACAGRAETSRYDLKLSVATCACNS